MKKVFILFALLLSCSLITKAADLLVNETGSGGYTAISEALTAAVDGDRIFIEPKSGGAPYIEALTITKSVQLLSNIEGGLYKLQGNISIATSTPKEIAIIGVDIIGSISSPNDASASSRTIVKVLYSNVLGNINFNKNHYDITVANCTVTDGYVAIRSGRIIGNDISISNDDAIFVLDETNTAPTVSDTIQIIGNRISCTSTSDYAINVDADDYFYQINNNYIIYRLRGINILDWNNNVVGTNEINNNTFKRNSYSATNYAMYLGNLQAGGALNIYNNLFDGINESTAYGIRFSSMNGTHNVSYNYFDDGFDQFLWVVTNDGTNLENQTFTIDAVTGEPTSGTYVDLGHPDLIYYDHDLTRNNLGCFGGSNSMDNYFITGDANNNRVYLINMPKSVFTGAPIRVEAESFDK